MPRFIFATLFVYMSSIPALAQDSIVILSNSAASAGAVPETGTVYGGISIVSVALASTFIAALVAFMVDEKSAVSSTSSTN